jgi:hypothetical protein
MATALRVSADGTKAFSSSTPAAEDALAFCAQRPHWMAQNLGELRPYGPGLE